MAKKSKPNPVFKGLPKNLKDVKEFERIEKELHEVLHTDHKHKVIKLYMKCDECQKKFHKRKKMIKELGFNSILQYIEWKKVMQYIIKLKQVDLKSYDSTSNGDKGAVTSDNQLQANSKTEGGEVGAGVKSTE